MENINQLFQKSFLTKFRILNNSSKTENYLSMNVLHLLLKLIPICPGMYDKLREYSPF